MNPTRRLRPFFAAVLILASLAGGGLILKGFILGRLQAAIQSSFYYDAISLSAFPPGIVIEGARSVSVSPSLIARRVEIRIPFAALFRREKSFRVVVDGPVVRLRDAAPGQNTSAGPVPGGAAAAPMAPKTGLLFPVALESVVVRDGEIHYAGRAGTFAVRKIKAAFRQGPDAFTLRLEAAESAFAPPAVSAAIGGRIRLVLEGRGPKIDVRQIEVQGVNTLVRARGTLTNPADPELDLEARVHAPIEAVAALVRLPFVWGGRAVGQGRIQRKFGRLDVRADFQSDDFVLNGVPAGRAEGTVAIGGDGFGRVDVVTRRAPAPPETVGIDFGGGKVSGTVQGAHLDPILRYLRVPYPVRSPAWGAFTLEAKHLRARAEFRDEPGPPAGSRYACRGLVDVTWDGAAAVTVASKRLETSFGTVEADAAIDIGRSVRVSIRGDVSDARQAREFTSLLLKEPLTFPEIRGRGNAEVKILGEYFSPQVKIDFAVAPGGFDRFDAAAASGTVEVAKSDVTGIFNIRDPEMRGEVRLAAGPGGAMVRIAAEEASLERVLPSLRLDLPLRGRGAGEFTATIKGRAVRVAGSFTSGKAFVAGQPLTDVRGMMTWSDATGTLEFPEIQARIYGGRVRGAGTVGFKERTFDIDLKTEEDFDLSTLVPSASGRLAFTLKGKGSLDRDEAPGTFAARGLAFATIADASAAGTIGLSFRERKLGLRLDGAIDPGGNEIHATLAYPQPDGSYQIGLKGKLLNPDLLVPWKGVKGEMNYILDLKGGPALDVSGVVDFMGPVFPIPGFAHTLNDYSGLLRIQNGKVSIRSLQAKLGGGDVTGSGEIGFGAGAFRLDVRAEGRGLLLSVIDRTRAQVDASLRLLKDESRASLTGEVIVKSLSWKRELSDRISFSTGPVPEPRPGKGIFDDLTLDIRVRGDSNAVLENSLGRVQGRFDLTVTGGINAPVILGDIEGLRGSVMFQDRAFRVLRARLSFFNPTAIEPYLDFQGETYLKDYRVTFSLNGLVDRLRPEFASSPPLPPEDVLALLALGESFKRTYSYDTSSQLGTGSLLSAQLVENAKKRAEQLFSLDRFRIDPFVLGASSEMTARLTVGKKISRNILLLYSTNLTSQREEIVRLEWEFSEIFSLVGMRNERGRISFDAKVRMRF